MFGLPEEVKFCTRCVISNQRPSSTREYSHVKDSKKETIHFDEEGVCSACRIAEQKESVNWRERDRELEELLAQYRGRGNGYDCLVPGSGGKDSFLASHILRSRYGMHPLTVTWAPHLYTDWGWRNFHRWTAGNDNYLCTPASGTHRLLTRLAVENLFHPFQPFIIGQKSLAPKLASLFNIPLVFYGESEEEYGNPRGGAQRDSRFHTGSDISIGGVSLDRLRTDYALTASDLEPYMPASESVLARARVEVHYLGYYLKWHPQSAYYYAVEHGGFECSPERTPGTYSKYNSIDDKIDDLHYWTTYIKFGIGRATYDAAQEIRSGDITREEGIRLVRRFDGEYPERFEKELLEYLSVPGMPSVTRESLFDLSDKFRSEHLWDGRKLKHGI